MGFVVTLVRVKVDVSVGIGPGPTSRLGKAVEVMVRVRG